MEYTTAKMISILLVFVLLCNAIAADVEQKQGPDPWGSGSYNYEPKNVPPDIKIALSSGRKSEPTPVTDYFFKRLLNIMLKSGVSVLSEDGSREINIAMKISPERWKILEQYTTSDSPFTEEIYRRTVGYISDAIFKPTLKEKVVQAWSEYVITSYYYYQNEITWILTMCAIVVTAYILFPLVTFYTVLWIIFILMYFYEGFMLYKEHEKKEFDKFVSAVSNCKWKFWTTSCQMPITDSLGFLKYMHPVKILMRLLGNFITEPVIIFSSTINEIINSITCNLYPPFNTIANGILMILLNCMFISLIVMILFTVIFKRTFNASFLLGLINFDFNRSSSRQNTNNTRFSHNGDMISGENLQKLIEIAHKIQDKHYTDGPLKITRPGRPKVRTPCLQIRSHSAGR